MSNYVIPFFIAIIMIIGLAKKVDVFTEFTEGAKENLKASVSVLPSLIALMTAIGMFKASGALELISTAISPMTSFLGFPEECIPLAIIRPISGSGALAVFENILTDVSPDSIIVDDPSSTAFATSLTSARVGRILYVMLSSISVAVITNFPLDSVFKIMSFFRKR